MCSDNTRHWQNFARLWSLLGPPLRPAPEDVAIVNRTVDEWCRDHGAPHGLILGVTPEVYPVLKSVTADIIAVDNSQAMIDEVWPGPPTAAVCADWTEMPLPNASRDIVLCDGGMILLPHPTGHEKLVEELRRIVSPGGVCVLRLFVPPEEPEQPAAIVAELVAGKIPNLNRLKLRLWAALQTELREGMRVQVFWRLISGSVQDLGELAQRVGWSLDEVEVLEAYRDSPARYCFPGIAEVRHLFCEEPGGFAFVSATVPEYPLGDRCPTVVFCRDS